MSSFFVFFGSIIYVIQLGFAALSDKTFSRPNINLISIACHGLLLGVLFVSGHCAYLYAELAELPTEAPTGAPIAAEYGRLVAASILAVAGYETTKAVVRWIGATNNFRQIFLNFTTGATAVMTSGVLLYYMLR
ncbi:hypothetical protein [Desulfoscipio geothermicus]|uniref:Uncharacterized protein n=1 Tax=Desulfoscipio geothermicus DSM 3669 TaxID=1121426 RepID=A0A1I6DNB9_9FIRM|nr:hypothetical protein [Desulfoscipio geothermicus]SFR06950.1 hypothetical protein SAMN05660706_11413 [Desulfoscipio geothermicus DSM 3669]